MTAAILVGDVWRSRDYRDDGLLVTVLAYDGRFVTIQRFRKSRVRADRFRRDYEPARVSRTGTRT